jgi:hypothetical protein
MYIQAVAHKEKHSTFLYKEDHFILENYVPLCGNYFLMLGSSLPMTVVIKFRKESKAEWLLL